MTFDVLVCITLYQHCTQVMSCPVDGLLQLIGGTTLQVQVHAFSQIEHLHVSRPVSCLCQQAWLMSAGLCQHVCGTLSAAD